ncbi:hypothetical protein OSB04_031804 [Centaurea solstitialis]|uniref:CCHC-type domain-containing protein n=1 Tax=Centaurea solstitialis TaxID=347529 RepID=A0AA38SND2_9ASTR|nr:hypothetical protein OSB04_031804 [Centaurea solstitialis]
MIRFSMGDIVRGSIEEPETVVDYLKNIARKYKQSDIGEGARLYKMFNELKFFGEGNLRDLDIGVKDEQVVHMGLESLPISYNNLRSIKKENKYKPKKTTNFKAKEKSIENKGSKTFKYRCYLCKKVGHMKKECSSFKAWMTKKGNVFPNSVFSLEVNFINISLLSYWIDSGSPIHITTSLQGITKRRKPQKFEQQVCVGNGAKVAVKAIGTLELDLGLEKSIFLDNVYFIPSLKRNLIFAVLLVKNSCKLVIDYDGIKIFQDSNYLGCGNFNNTTITGTKRTIVRENSANLWHRRLDHISKDRLKALVKNNSLPDLDFSDLQDCIECFKGKQNNKFKKTSVRSGKLLELIHTHICGPFKHITLCGNTYFLTFIDDYSRFYHIYLLSEKSQALDAFRISKTEVELQLENKI